MLWSYLSHYWVEFLNCYWSTRYRIWGRILWLQCNNREGNLMKGHLIFQKNKTKTEWIYFGHSYFFPDVIHYFLLQFSFNHLINSFSSFLNKDAGNYSANAFLLRLIQPVALALLVHQESEAMHMQKSSAVWATLTDIPVFHRCSKLTIALLTLCFMQSLALSLILMCYPIQQKHWQTV